MLSRRSMLLTPAVLGLRAGSAAAAGRMTLCIHTNTSSGAGYRGALEGWAKAGIKEVELNAALVEDFLQTDTLAGARRVLADNGLRAVHGAVGVTGLLEPNPNHAAALDTQVDAAQHRKVLERLFDAAHLNCPVEGASPRLGERCSHAKMMHP